MYITEIINRILAVFIPIIVEISFCVERTKYFDFIRLESSAQILFHRSSEVPCNVLVFDVRVDKPRRLVGHFVFRTFDKLEFTPIQQANHGVEFPDSSKDSLELELIFVGCLQKLNFYKNQHIFLLSSSLIGS